MPQKASTPWSNRSVAEGGTDSPVGDLVPIPDKITPVVNTGFISLAGKYRGIPSDDLAFTFQDPYQAVAAGASIFIDVDMVQHDILILGILDSSGNDVNVTLQYLLPATPRGPYNNPVFTDVGIAGGATWQINKNTTNGTFYDILNDDSNGLGETWKFFCLQQLRATVGSIKLLNNDGADTGTISTAYLRLV